MDEHLDEYVRVEVKIGEDPIVAADPENFLVIPKVDKVTKSNRKRGTRAKKHESSVSGSGSFKVSSSGAAMDVVVVLPLGNDTLAGEEEALQAKSQVPLPQREEFDAVAPKENAVSSSEFYVQFPSRDEGLLSSFSRMSILSSSKTGRARGSAKKERTTSAVLLEKSASGDSVEDTSRKDEIRVFINGTEIHNLRMKRQADGTCHFINGKGLKPEPNNLLYLIRKKAIRPGKNLLRYVLDSTLGVNSSLDVNYFLECTMYLWDSSDSIIVSDIDGTITKSDVGGVMDTVVTERYTHAHKGVCKLYTDLYNLVNDGHSVSTDDGLEVLYDSRSYSYPTIRFVYLTSRPIALLDSTRKYVRCLKQGGYMLPEGPVFCHKGTLSEVLYTELIKKNTFEFKSDVIQQQVVIPFAGAGRRTTDRLIVAGFGNKDLDAVAYEMAGASKDDIYIINPRSEITCFGNRFDHIPQPAIVIPPDLGCEDVTRPQSPLNKSSPPHDGIRRSASLDQDNYNYDLDQSCSSIDSSSSSLSNAGRKRLQKMFRSPRRSRKSTNMPKDDEESPGLSLNNSFSDDRVGREASSYAEDDTSSTENFSLSRRSKKLPRRVVSSLRPARMRRNMSDTLYLSRSEMGIFKSYDDPLLGEVVRSKLLKAVLHDVKEHPLLEEHTIVDTREQDVQPLPPPEDFFTRENETCSVTPAKEGNVLEMSAKHNAEHKESIFKGEVTKFEESIAVS